MDSARPARPDAGWTTPAPGPQETRRRRIAAALLGLEALALLAAASVSYLSLDGAEGVPRNFGLGLAVFLVVFAVLLVLGARSLLVRGRFGLGYGITWQLFQALVGASMLKGGLVLAGGFALLVAILAFVVLLNLVHATPLPFSDEDADPSEGSDPDATSRGR